MSLGNRAVSSFSIKQKINGKISTEYDMIGVDNATAKILWSEYFIEAKGHNVEDNKLL